MAHVFIVNKITFKYHLEYMFAGTGASQVPTDFIFDASIKLNTQDEKRSVGMITDVSRIKKGDKILFFVTGISKLYGIFEAESEFFLDPNDSNNFLVDKLEKILTYRILIKPFKVYKNGISEYDCLDSLEGVKYPDKICWSLIYRKLGGNRGCTMITNQEYEIIENKLSKDNSLINNGENYSFDTDNDTIISSNTLHKYTGRKIDIENSKGFNKDNDIVIMSPISDLGTLCDEVSKIVNTYSDQYGKTAEFSMWSHSALDGPRGSTETSQYQIYRNQMSLEGWGRINFNWDEKASANFFGCRSGSAENGTSFSTNISALDNFKNVTVHGQVSYAYPSVYTNARQTNKNIIAEKPNYPTYFVGSERSVFWGRVMPTFTEAYPMRESMNGYGHVNRYYQPGRKTRR